jgi:MoxR-like ATPase
MPLSPPRFAASFTRAHAHIHGDGLQGQYGPYIADPGLVHAANTAVGLGRPLLLTGAPGCGKSDFAWVAANALGHQAPLRCHVRSDTRARDLLYHYDALVRFGDAQHGDPAKKKHAEDPRRYVGLRPLGAALMIPGRCQVVLIDEIDKAPRDLPNDLLLELDEGCFEIPEIGDHDCSKSPVFDRRHPAVALMREMSRPKDSARPLVIITSNAERQLPEPFLRRCVFFHIREQPRARLLEIAQRRFPNEEHRLLDRLVRVFDDLRAHATAMQFTKVPTTSELLDWLTALTRLYDRNDTLDTINAFVDNLDNNKQLDASQITWSELPGVACLLKLKEDLEEVSPARAAAN